MRRNINCKFLSASIIGHLQLNDIKQREILEGTFGFAVRVPYESKKESQYRVAMCDNALMNELSIDLLTVTLP